MIGKKKNHQPEQTEEQTDTVTEAQIDEEMKELAAKPKKKKLPAWVIAPLIGLLVVGGILVPGKMKSSTNDNKQVDVVKVEKGDIKETYAINGVVKSNKIEKFYSPVNAPIDKIKANVGQIVKAGDVIVSFDVTNLEKDNQRAELESRQTQLTNQEMINNANKSQADAIDTQNQAVQSAVDAYNDLVNQQNAILDQMNNLAASVDAESQANAAHSQAYADAQAYVAAIDGVVSYDSTKISEMNQLIADGEEAFKNKTYSIDNYTTYNASNQAFDSTKVSITQYADLKVWVNNLTIQVNDLNALKINQQNIMNQNPVSTAQSEQYAALQQQYDALEPQIQQAAKAVESAGGSTIPSSVSSAQMENMHISEQLSALTALTAEQLVEKGKEGVKADFDGIVVAMQATAGTPAVQGGELFTIADMNNLTVSIEVPASDYQKVYVGEKATIVVGKNEYRGTVINVNQVATTADTTAAAGAGSGTTGSSGSTIGAVVRIDNADSNIIIGVTAKLTLVVSEEQNVLTLPIEVVNTNKKGDFVYVLNNGVVETKEVKVGGASDSKIEIVSGLKAGDEVVSDTSGDISEGMKATFNVTESN